MKKLSLGLLAAVLAAFAIAACGDDDGGEDEDQITDAIEFAATSGDPAACTEAQTQKFTEQTSGGATGDAAVRACEEDAEDAAGDSVEVENIEVDGDSATAEATFTGGFIDGQTLDLALVKEGDDWKLDEIVDFIDFDRDAFVSSFTSELEADEEVPPKAVDCITENLEAASDEELQDILLEPEGGQAIFEPCFGRGEAGGGGQGGAEGAEDTTETQGTTETDGTTDTQGSAGGQGPAGGSGGAQGGTGY